MQRKKIVDIRPWGDFEQFAANEKCTVKLLHMEKGKRLSYQYHKNRTEFWHVVSGRVRVTLNGRKKLLEEGDEIEIPTGGKHRGEGLVDSVVLEIDTGNFDENDVVRLQDDFGRK